MSKVGSTRLIQSGSHQLASPSSFMVAGTRTRRTTVASRKIAVARPSPIILIPGSSPSMKPKKTAIMMSAALVITRPVRAMARTTDASLSPVSWYSSRTLLSRKTS